MPGGYDVLMVEYGFDITITPGSVDVRQDDSTGKPGANRRDGVLVICVAIFLFCCMMFGSRHSGGHSAWTNLHDNHWPSLNFVLALVMTILTTGLTGSMFLYGVRLFFPSGAALHCDRSTFTVSKIPSSNLRGQWKSLSFPVSDIADFKFAVTQPGGRGASLYGFCFCAAGRRQKLFVGLETPEADEILRGLEHLGVDVVRGPSK
jgi:hypothetical protein